MNNTEKRRAEKLIDTWLSANTESVPRYYDYSFEDAEIKAKRAEIAKLEEAVRRAQAAAHATKKVQVANANKAANDKAKALTFGVWNGDYTFAQLAEELN